MTYCVSRNGTFGWEIRRFFTDSGKEMIVIQWGPLGWITVAPCEDVHFCYSHYECQAREEAEKWLEG
jgi:hypothetical protein